MITQINAVLPVLNFQIKYNVSPNKVWFPSKESINKVWLTYKYFPQIPNFAWKSINLEWHGFTNICIAYASAKRKSKFILDMLIGRLTADMYQISKEKIIN